MTSFLKQSTAMALCLALVAPMPATAQQMVTTAQGEILADEAAVQDARAEVRDALERLETARANVLASATDVGPTGSNADVNSELEKAERAARKAQQRADKIEAAYQAWQSSGTDTQVTTETQATDTQTTGTTGTQATDTQTATETADEMTEEEKAARAARKAEQRAAKAAAAEAEVEVETQSDAPVTVEMTEEEKAARAARKAEQRAAEAAEEERIANEERAARKSEQRAAKAAEEDEAARQARIAERRAARQAERRDARAAQEGTEAEEVEVETVTEGTVRTSDEDFDTDVTGTPTATSSGSSGLSKFEKALLLGLGAVVVGSVLKNGDRVVSNSGDRVVVERDGDLRVLKNDNELLRQPGADVRTETFGDGSTRTTVTRQNGDQVVTIAAADGTVIERFLRRADGSEVTLIDDTVETQPVQTSFLQTDNTVIGSEAANIVALRAALGAGQGADIGRTFSLGQVRDIRQVRELVPTIELNSVTFATGSAAITPSEAEELAEVGTAITRAIDNDPSTIFLIEGHTDAVGGAAYNLSLSDRRAESVALALTEYFAVPPENLITQGYGESALKIQTEAAERANRRASVRNITSLLR